MPAILRAWLPKMIGNLAPFRGFVAIASTHNKWNQTEVLFF
jgi:hypothetical protein